MGTVDQSDLNDHTLDMFDRTRGGMEMRNDVTRTRVSTVRHVDPLVGNVATFLIESIRTEEGDYAFVEVATKDGNVRVVLPPKVTNALARQRDALTKKVRKRIGRELGISQAAERKAQGIEPFGGKPFIRKAKTA
jgi:hypothetical protein